MNTKDLKIGETYLLPITVTAIEKSGWIESTTCNNYEYRHTPSEVKTLRQNTTKNTETAPKYDPCRKFKKGDVVRIVERHKRYQPNIPVDELWKGLCTVAEDEDFCNNLVKVRSEDGREKLSHWWYLELVTPAEELEPYSVKLRQEITVDDTYPYCAVVDYDGNEAARFYCEQYEAGKAKVAAEAECARLNAEYRK